MEKAYKIECVNEDGNTENNGYYFKKEEAEKEAKILDEQPGNKRYAIIPHVIEIEIY